MAKAARIRYTADGNYVDKQAKEFTLTAEIIEKLDSIEPSAEKNAIQGIKVNGQLQEPDQYRVVSLAIPEVEDNLDSISSTNALSAKQGRFLYNRIKNLEGLGKFLSNWDSTTGMPTTNPQAIPYEYHSGDYYIVGRVGATNYRPDGTSYRGIPSTVVEQEEVKVGDFYFFNGNIWELLLNTDRQIPIDESLSSTSTNPVENRVVTAALNLKANDADISVVGKTNDFNDLNNIPDIPDSLDDLTGTSDDITEGTSHLFLTSAERIKLTNTTGTNTGDETNASIMSKLGAASSTTNGYLTVADWNTFNDKQASISDLETIRSNASAGKNASDTIATYGDVVTHDANEFATAAQGGKADTALQPGDNVSELTNDVGYVTDAYHDSTKQDKLIAGTNIQIAADGKTISATDTTYVAGDFDIKDLADSTGLRAEWSGKQDELIAGSNIQIAADGKTISATDTKYSAGAGISISNNNVISAIDNKAAWGSIEGTLSNQTDLQSALNNKQNTLTAGANIQIAQDGTISATDTTYTAGTGIDITNGVISNTQTSAEWGNIQGDITDQTDLQDALGSKQNTLIAGANIQISGSTISATDTKYTASDFDIKDLADSTGKRASWDAKQNAISDLATIRSNASTAIQPNDNVSELTNDAGYITSADIPTLDTAMSSTSTKGVQNKVIKSYVDTQVQEATAGAVSDTAYGSSWDGVIGIAPSKNAVYDKLNAMDTTIAGKQATISDLSTIRSGASKGATAVQPGDNVSTLTNDAGFITKAVSDLTNYYTKSEVYTKAEVADYVANFSGFDVVATLPTTDIKTTVIYLLGPVGTGADKYEEYIYSNNTWIKIGDTSIDLSPYFNKNSDTSDVITEGSTHLFLTSAERTKLSNTSGTNSGDETKATIQSKLGAASSSASGYLTSTDWNTFNNKQAAISDLATIRSNATAGAGAATTIAGYGDIVTHNADEFLTTDKISDTAYASSWNGVTDVAPSKNAVYDKLASMDTAINGKQDTISDLSTIRSNASAGKSASDTIANYGDIVSHNASEFLTTDKISNTAYGTSWNGVTNVAPSKDAVYDKLSSMDTTIAGKQATISDLATIRSGASAGATAVQPGDNVSTLNNDAGFITKAVSDLTNYYTKNETYTKSEVADYVANFAGFKVVATLPTTDIKTTIIYLLGPVGTGADKYEEYIYSNNAWVKIGETSVDLTNYFNTSTDNSDSITQGSTNLFLTSAERTKLSNTSGTNTGDETKATIQSKLGAATSSNDGYLTSADWTKFNNKQNTLSTSNAGENIKISNGVISANNVFIITEDDVTVSTSEDYGVAPYNTNYKYTNIDISADAGIEWREGAIYTFVVNTEMVVASAYRNTRVRIGNGDYIPVMGSSTVAAGSSYFTKTNTRQFQYTTKYEAGGALHIFTDSNTTYSAMSASEANTGTATSARSISASVLKGAIQTHAVNDTAYASSWNGVTTQAPSKNAVYDKISAMDTTIADKLDKIDIVAGLDRAYIVTAAGAQTTYNISQGASNGAIVRRSGTQIIVPETPTDNTHAASKKYVDDVVAQAGGNVIAMTQAEYNALSSSEKADGKLRIISDAPTIEVGNVSSTSISSLVVSNSAPASGTPNSVITFVI